MPAASRIASEIGTSMLSRPTRSASQACLKKGCAENAMIGSEIAAETQWNRSRVASAAPDHTAMDRIITFIMPNPATPSRISMLRELFSVAVVVSTLPSSS